MPLSLTSLGDESARLDALRRLRILDTPREERFDRLARLAARLLNVPIALVSFVDAERQWFKSAVGGDFTETPRSLSFCDHALRCAEPLIVPDATEDERFARNVLVTGEPGIRFYMGQPLEAPDGQPVGTLCVIDRHPRHPSAEQVQTLKDLAVLVQRELHAIDAEEALARLQETQRELAAQKAKFEAFIENSPCVIFMKDERGRNVFMNRRGEELFGLSPDQPLGTTDAGWPNLNPEETVQESDRRVFDSVGAVENVDLVPMPSGDLAHWLVVEFPFTEPDGRRLIGGVAIDVTAAKKAESALREAREAAEQARAEAEQANRMKSQFLANMSHEVRTPLHGIMGVMEMVEETELTGEQRALVEMVRASSSALLGIVNDILDFSKVEAGRMDLCPENFELSALVREVVMLYSPRARQKGLTIETQRNGDLPRRLYGDAGRLKQVLGNLVSNSVKFSESGVVKLELRREPDESGAASASDGGKIRLRLSVSDQGIGIPEEAQSRVFEPFAQADGSTTRRFGGTGLGLSIARQMVELMGGRLELQSAPGQGACFSFTAIFGVPEEAFPDASAEVVSTSPLLVPLAPCLSAPCARDHSAAKLRVLLAEDSKVSAMLALHQLEKLDCRVEAVADGAMAVRAWQKERHDLILMDCQMPVLDGYAAAARIRQIEGADRRTVIFAVTANAVEGEREKCIRAGMNDLLGKPFRLEQLGAVIHVASCLLESKRGPGSPSVSRAEIDVLRRESPGGGLLNAMIDIWRRDWPRMAAEMELACQTLDGEALGRIAHKVKGGAAVFGAVQLQTLGRLCEELCREKMVTFAVSLLPAVKNEAARVLAALEIESAVSEPS